jgi:hypothetical protein
MITGSIDLLITYVNIIVGEYIKTADFFISLKNWEGHQNRVE